MACLYVLEGTQNYEIFDDILKTLTDVIFASNMMATFIYF